MDRVPETPRERLARLPAAVLRTLGPADVWDDRSFQQPVPKNDSGQEIPGKEMTFPRGTL